MKTRFETVPLSDREIVDMFTKQNNGVVVGYGLYNSLGITTQVPKRLIVYSSLADEQLKQIGNVVIQKYDLDYTDEVKAVIYMMELLQHYKEIQDINYSAFLRNVEALSKQYTEGAFEVVQRVIGYSKRTVALLREAINFYHPIGVCDMQEKRDLTSKQEIKKGYWIFEEYPDGYYHSECSVCGHWFGKDAYLKKYKFCPNCRSTMGSDDNVNE